MIISEIDSTIEAGKTPLGASVNISLRNGLIGLIQGQSGSGKSILGGNIISSLAEKLHNTIQIIAVDPKRVSLNWLAPRAHIYRNESDWLSLMQSLCSELDRRYLFMENNGLDTFPITSKNPYLLLYLEEMSAITNNQRLLKKERDQFQILLIDYVNRCRQCGMGILIVCQSADSNVMPTVVRSNCSTRFAMRTMGQEQVKMIAAGREEECPCDLLTLPGQFYALTSETNGRWVKGRTQYMSDERRRDVINRIACDKRTPYCLDWDSPDFLG